VTQFIVHVPSDTKAGDYLVFAVDVDDRRWLSEDRLLVIVEKPSPSFQPRVRILRFYESGYDVVPHGQRVYAERFARETTRYVNWELNFEHPAPGRRVDFQLTAVYYRVTKAGVEEVNRHTVDTYVEGDWTWSSHSSGYGFNDPGKWALGEYRVKTIFEGQTIADYVFEIY
jgi:hypothetical protein